MHAYFRGFYRRRAQCWGRKRKALPCAQRLKKGLHEYGVLTSEISDFAKQIWGVEGKENIAKGTHVHTGIGIVSGLVCDL